MDQIWGSFWFGVKVSRLGFEVSAGPEISGLGFEAFELGFAGFVANL